MTTNVFFAIIIVLCLIRSKNRILNIIMSVLALSLMISLLAYNNASTDQFAYLHLYTNNDYFKVEGGYLILTNIFCNFLKMDYIMFKIVIFSIFSILIYFSFRKYQLMNFRIALLLWFLSSFCFDAEQSRYTIAACIVAIGIPFLNQKGILNGLKFLIAVILATTIHTSSLIYLILFLTKLKIQKIKVPIFIFVGMMTLLFIVRFNFSFIGDILYIFIKNERIKMWFNYTTNLGWVGPTIIHILFFLVISKGKNSILKNKNAKSCHVKYVIFMYKIALIMFIPNLFNNFSTEFIRIDRVLYLLYFLAILVAYSYSSVTDKLIYISFMIMFPIIFNIQGLNGLLFMNDYFLEYYIGKNEISNNLISVLIYCLIMILLFIVINLKNKHYKNFCKN